MFISTVKSAAGKPRGRGPTLYRRNVPVTQTSEGTSSCVKFLNFPSLSLPSCGCSPQHRNFVTVSTSATPCDLNKVVCQKRIVSGVMNGTAALSSWLRSSRVTLIVGNGGGSSDGAGNGATSNNSRRSLTGKDLGETSILRQEGHNIDEVPAAVIRTASEEKPKKGPSRSYVDLDPSEESAFIEGFGSFHTPQQVLKMLDTIPCQEVTPFVSFSILKKLFELENNFGFRNDGRSWLNASENSTTETFTRLAIVTRLVDTILTSEDSNLLIDTLDLLRRECPHVNDQTHGLYDPDNHLDYRNKLLQEMLVRVTEGKLELNQVCRAVVTLGKMETDKGYGFSKDFVDKFWVGILGQSEDITSENIVNVLHTVKYFKKSSRLVLNLLERKLVTLWWNMSPKIVAEMCSVFMTSSPMESERALQQGINSWQISTRLLMALSKCTNLNIHKVTEAELIKIVKAFHTLNFCDTVIEQALSKYMKAKCLKIIDPQLVSTIMDYARKFRLRSSSILEAGAEFVIKHEASNLSPPQLTSILRPFGELDFQPPQGPKFWEAVEAQLNEKFIQFPPNDLVTLLLCCVCLMKYPLNFVDRTFSPYFLDRLHTSEPDFHVLQQHRSNLKLLDAILSIECKNKYGGPMLPKDFSSRALFIDGRILRVASVLKETLLGMCKHSSIDTSLILPGLPLHPLFTADVLLTTPKCEAEVDRNSSLKIHVNSHFYYQVPPPVPIKIDRTIILVNIPEHFSSDGKHLIGFQSLRKRFLKSLGFHVVTLRYQTLIETKNDFSAFTDYITKKLQQAVEIPL